jgi:hypothetical protein
MAGLVAIPVMVILMILQTTMVSRLPLLSGTADLMLVTLIAWALQERVKNAWIWTVIGGLMASFVSAVPFYSLLAGYLVVTVLARWIRHYISQAPILTLLVMIMAGSLITNGITLVTLRLTGTPVNWLIALNQIILPGMLLNLVIAIPIHTIIVDLAGLLYPQELEA